MLLFCAGALAGAAVTWIVMWLMGYAEVAAEQERLEKLLQD